MQMFVAVANDKKWEFAIKMLLSSPKLILQIISFGLLAWLHTVSAEIRFFYLVVVVEVFWICFHETETFGISYSFI